MKIATLALDVNTADTLLAETFAEIARFVASTHEDLESTSPLAVVVNYDGHKVTVEISGT